jgi:hypothetical protein
MPQKKTSKAKNEPIVLSGSVFLDGILAEDHPRARMPLQLRVGDIRLHNVNKPGERPRFGETITFSGFIRACVWDGKRFRSLLLRKRAACESTYVGPVARRERSMAVLRFLSNNLVRRTAEWSVDGKGYVVGYTATVAPAPEPAPEAEPKPVPEAEPKPEAPATTTAHPARMPVPRRRRRKAADENQLPLFDNLK